MKCSYAARRLKMNHGILRQPNCRMVSREGEGMPATFGLGFDDFKGGTLKI